MIMNYDLLKEKMDKYFNETSAEEIIAKFQALGYVFKTIADIDDAAEDIDTGG